eukprot:330722_1
MSHPAFNYYSVMNRTIKNLNEIKYKIIGTNTKNEITSYAYQRQLYPFPALNWSSLSIHIKSKKLFDSDDYIKLQDVDASIMYHCSNMFYENLKFQQNKIILQDISSINSRYYAEILKAKFVLLLDDIGKTEISTQYVHDNHCHVNQFDDINVFHLTIPDKINVQIIRLYVQFSDGLNYV